MTVVSEVAESKLIEFINKHHIVHKQTNVRPWGSYDLTLESAAYNGTLTTGQTFGWGFTTERAAAIALVRIVRQPQGHAHLQQWLGIDVFAELLTLCETIDKVEQLKAEIQVETQSSGSLAE